MSGPIQLLSLGAGVQSTCLALMFEHGEVPGCGPLDEIDFGNGGQQDMWGEECEGLCGV